MSKGDKKTVMIAGNDAFRSEHIKLRLEEQGFNVVFADCYPTNVDFINSAIHSHQPKIDALIINNPEIEKPDSRTALKVLATLWGNELPVIVWDSSEKKTDIQPLEKAGIKYLNSEKLSVDQLAFGVANAVKQHGKPGRKVGG